MIGHLKGILIEKKPPSLVLDVNGVGYEISASMNTFYCLPSAGETAALFTHLVTREDAMLLYGFADEKERTLFRMLIKVNNVGPRLALTILSGDNPDGFVRCIMNNDTGSLVRLPGVGKKTAERLIIEMRDRLQDWQGSLPATQTDNSIIEEAVSALVALGYKPQEANRLVNKNTENIDSSEQLIRQALKGIA